MHFPVLVIGDCVEYALEPWQEDPDTCRGEWDYWTVGGRWPDHLTLKDGTRADTCLVREFAGFARNPFAIASRDMWSEENAAFPQILDGLRDDVRITMVDCHV